MIGPQVECTDVSWAGAECCKTYRISAPKGFVTASVVHDNIFRRPLKRQEFKDWQLEGVLS